MIWINKWNKSLSLVPILDHNLGIESITDYKISFQNDPLSFLAR